VDTRSDRYVVVGDSKMIPNLRTYMKKVGADLRQKFGAQRAQDPRVFKECAVRYLRLALGPGPGRPPKQTVTQAVKMRAEGKAWPEIYSACLAHSEGMTADTWTIACLRLRSAVRSRRSAERRRRNSR
jgi:hypothetical protein